MAEASTKPPRRFVIFYSQHGTLPWLWRPKGTGTDFELGPLLAPLAPYKKDLILLDGIDFKGLSAPGSLNDFKDGHARGQGGSLTASTQIEFNRTNGISIDYYIARGLQEQNGGKPVTAVPNVQADIIEIPPIVQTWGQPYHSAPGQVVRPERDANRIFNRLFPNGMVPGGSSAKAPDSSALRQSAALDYVAKELRLVREKLGRVEAERLEQHATLVDDLKKRMTLVREGALLGNGQAACAAPEVVPKQSGGYKWEATRPHVPKLMQAAFACDMTRVFAIQVEEPPARLWGGHAGFDSIHGMVHALKVEAKDNQNAGLLSKSRAFYTEYANIFKEVLDLLMDLKEADGKPMLYHTCVLWCGELAQPGHSTGNCKWLTAGQLGGYLKTGQVLSFDGDGAAWCDGGNGPAGWSCIDPKARAHVPSNGDVFTTIANGMGVPTARFGSGTTGEIAAMKA
jgi:hypothetical protein